MTIHDFSLGLPPRRLVRWLGVALAGLLVIAGSRVLPELGPDPRGPQAQVPFQRQRSWWQATRPR